MFLRRPEELTTDEQQTLARLRNLDPEVDLAYELVQQFARILRERTGKEQLDGWLVAPQTAPSRRLTVANKPFPNLISALTQHASFL